MAKPIFKSYNQGQISLFPASLDEKIPQNSPVRTINQIVDNLDITKVLDTYKGGGTSAYHPRMMLKVILYSYLNNIYSCRKIEQALLDRVSFMWLASNQTPDHNTINRFRSSHLKNTIHQIFTQVVVMLVDMGYLSLDVIYVDGTKLESRANRYTFVWRKSVEKNKAKLEAKIRKVLEMVESGAELRDRLWSNARLFREKMSAAGFTLAGADHAIIPVMLGDAVIAQNFARELQKEGIYVTGFFFPVVPKGQARIRTQMSAAHTPEQIERAVEAFTRIGKQLGVIA